MRLQEAKITDYKEARDFLGERETAQVGYATTIHKRGDCIAIYHHKTAIVVFEAGGAIHLSNGGYFTPTTKKRLNLFTPEGFRVFQRDHAWYLETPEGTVDFSGWAIIFDNEAITGTLSEVKGDG